jgi:flavodoxin
VPSVAVKKYNTNLEEVNLENIIEDNLERIKLKKPNEVYYELYKQARTRAKECKKNSLIAYLEAKNIKKTYMLENLNDSDDDFEEEMEEFCENEIEDLEF